MVNNEEFASRLQKVIDYYTESASSFADAIGVQRSSISHILSGRNKPSLEFVLKILSTYPEVELYWLLNGKGSFPSKTDTSEKDISKKNLENTPPPENGSEKKITANNPSKGKTIDRIVIFYNDGSFENFQN